MKYKIICGRCNSSDVIIIVQDRLVDWQNSTSNNIISARLRLDGQWGFQCLCGNYDILTKQETKQITNKQDPDPKEIAQIVKDLKPDKMKFKMAPLS